jgi:hypothetical protein
MEKGRHRDLEHHWISVPSDLNSRNNNQGANYEVNQFSNAQAHGDNLPGVGTFLNAEPLCWPSLAYDTLWTMGNYTYADPLDAQGILEITNLNF